MMIKTEAIVLSSIKYRDSDLIVKCYTKALGIVTFMVKGVLKSKRGKFKNAMFQALSLIDIEFQNRQKSQLEYFKEVHVSHPLNSIQSNVYKSAIVMFIAEILKSVIIEEEENESLFEYIKTQILSLESSTSYSNFHLMFLIKLTKFLGFFPQQPKDDYEIYFNLTEGYFESHESLYSLNIEHSTLLRKFITRTKDNTNVININNKQRQKILEILLRFYELHIYNFKVPKSLNVFKSIFT